MESYKILFMLCFFFCYSGIILSYGNGKDLLPDTDVCGEVAEDQIFGGSKMSRHEFPWLVVLEYLEGNHSKFKCGGSLINYRYVLTSEHCARNKNLIKVRLGEYSLTHDPDCDLTKPEGIQDCSEPMLRMDIEEKIFHDFDDIALLRLPKDVPYSASVKPICLPITEELLSNDFSGIKMMIAGYGCINDSTTTPDVPYKVEIPVVPHSVCITTGLLNPIYEKHICAGGEVNKDSCYGDSGGPLMYRNKEDGNWYLVGIVSSGLPVFGQEGIPSIYMRVTNYISWITDNMKR